jgi:P-type Ca2+ transporter type 2C
MKQGTQHQVVWHTLDLPALCEMLQTTEAGLSTAEATARLETCGPNQLPHQPEPAWWHILLRQFRSPLIYILGAAAIVSLALGEGTDAAFIAAVLGVNALIGSYQEWRAEKSTRALQKLLQMHATVVRDGEMLEINAEAVVPGDVVWLESGNRVPADMRLLMMHGLEVDESLLTGESLAVLKDPAWTGGRGYPSRRPQEHGVRWCHGDTGPGHRGGRCHRDCHSRGPTGSGCPRY